MLTALVCGGHVLLEDVPGRRRREGRRFASMPYITLAALLPLGFVLLRRNL